VSGGWYLEPYAGGAGAAIHLLTRGYVDRIFINDIDPTVYRFWKVATNRSDELAGRILKAPIDMEAWEHHRAVHTSPHFYSDMEVAFATFFLNRTNRSGILRGGVIGGKGQTGSWKLDARFNRIELAARVRRIGSLAKQIAVSNDDAIDFVQRVRPDLPAKSLIYFDPPYFDKGSLLYENHYKPEDHAAIARQVIALRSPWLVTYDNRDEIRALYSNSQSTEFSMKYSTHTARPQGTEVMFYGNISLPSRPRLKR
jgi:DNA adenine methylase